MEKMRYQVCVVTGTRAEYGLLRETLFKLKNNAEIDLKLVVTGSHLSNLFGNTQEEIIRDGFSDFIKVPIPLDDDSKEGMASATGTAMVRFSELFRGYKPDILLVLGDRYEIFAAVSAAYLIGIPIAHISGGDVTEGAVDDAIRHCLTKMSYLHFPGCEQSAKRIIQMGEQPSMVFNVGEPGVENCLNMSFMPRDELANNIGFEGIKGGFGVVTFHPVTMEDNTAVEQVQELIKALNEKNDMSYLITMSNSDAGGRAINDIWISEGKKHPNWHVVTSLGILKYLSAVKYANVVIGNSSSGIIEAPALGTPTVNIGDRQKGRMVAESVVCCRPYKEDIIAAMNEVLTDRFHEKIKNMYLPFGNGTTSEQIVEVITSYLKIRDKTNEKQFYNIKF